MAFDHWAPVVQRLGAYTAAGVELVTGVALLVVARQQPALDLLGPVGILLVAGAWLVPWALLGVRYEITEGALWVRRGPSRQRIALSAIEEAASVPGAPEAPAAVLVRHRGARGSVTETLRPADPEGFLRHLRMSAPHLTTGRDGTLRGRAPNR